MSTIMIKWRYLALTQDREQNISYTAASGDNSDL